MGWFTNLVKSLNSNNQCPPPVLPRKNDPCWCGSGIKYKKCHLIKDKLYFKEHPKKKVAVKKACNSGFG